MIGLVILSLLVIGAIGLLLNVFFFNSKGRNKSFYLILVLTLLVCGAAIIFSSAASETTTKEIRVEQIKKGRNYNVITDENGTSYKVEIEVIYKTGIIPVYVGDTLLIKTTHLKNDNDLSDNIWEMVE